MDVLIKRAQGWEIYPHAEQENVTEHVENLNVRPPDVELPDTHSNAFSALQRLQRGLKDVRGVDLPRPAKKPARRINRPRRVFD